MADETLQLVTTRVYGVVSVIVAREVGVSDVSLGLNGHNLWNIQVGREDLLAAYMIRVWWTVVETT